MKASAHIPVLLQQTVLGLSLHEGDTAIDATAGGGGHAKAIAETLGASGTLLVIDRDEENLARAREALANSPVRLHGACGNFRDIGRMAGESGIEHAQGILFDLGWSSDHLHSGRGFTFQKDEPLLMTYEAHPGSDTLTARDIVNDWQEESIADVLFGYGEERQSRRIARAIVEARESAPIETSGALAAIVEEAIGKRGRIHPATKTFQALRIAVNDELGSLAEALPQARDLLAAGGRLAVITFHSIEDRMVKRAFLSWAKEGRGTVVTKHTEKPTREEARMNPRSRSAQLRIFEKN